MSEATSLLTRRRLRVEIHGAVQGVGFRPFVYRLATELGLAGWVINNSQGVFVEVEGEQVDLQAFLARLTAEQPSRAIIHTLDSAWLQPAGFVGFAIRHSEAHGSKTVLVLPDVATCPDCLAEVGAPADRRHRYPFTNCTNCGPRFTIIQALPYDRPNTTMRRFAMCPACQAEYDDPLDRRFHAQPNACPACGPQLALYGRLGAAKNTELSPAPGLSPLASNLPDALEPDDSPVSALSTASWLDQRPLLLAREGPEFILLAQADGALRLAADALCAGQIVAVKGLGGFHLMVDAANPAAIARLRRRKPRREKPFALMAQDLAQVRQICVVSSEAEALLVAPEAPIVLLPKRTGAPVADNVAPGNPMLGVMLPYTPLHHLLLCEVARSAPGGVEAHTGQGLGVVVATSGNLTDEPICTDEWEAMERLGHIADLFLVHDRPIARHADDSVAWIVDGKPGLLRRARGYAPLPVLLKQAVPAILAVGAHLKNTVAFSVDRQVFISQHIGDLETAEAMVAFERVIADFLGLYEAQPVAIAHDLHPDYLSTKWAQSVREMQETKEMTGVSNPSFPSLPFFPSPPLLVPVQHHHAHLAACLAENGVDGPALGVIWDGTGYGTDGTVWGGEFLLGDARSFTRVAHLRPFRLPGGDAAIKEPRRIAFAMLWELYGDQVIAWEHLAPVCALSMAERRVLARMLARSINAPVTTSAGRLFDGVAALIGLQQQVSFEGQAAMALEYKVDDQEHSAYPVVIQTQRNSGEPKGSASRASSSSLLLDWQPMVEAILVDLQRGASSGMMAARFHAALVEVIVAVAQLTGEPRVALTGGCFQNRLLTERAAQRLRQAGYEVLLHRQVPPNDGGISLGQIAVAAARLAQ